MHDERQLPCTVSQQELDRLRSIALLQAVPMGERFSVFVEAQSDLDTLSQALRIMRERPLKTGPAPQPGLAEHPAWPPHSVRAIA